MSEISEISEAGDITTAFLEVANEAPYVEKEPEILPLEPETVSLSLTAELKLFLECGGSKNDYIILLKTLFGPQLVERVIQTGVYDKWPDSIDKTNCYEMLGAIGHSVTVDDLEHCFAELKSGQTRTILSYSQIPYLRMWWAGTAVELPNFWINHLLDLFRNPLQILGEVDAMHLGKELESASLNKKRALSYCYYDYAVKELLENGDRSRPEFFLSHRELIAKYIAYAHPDTTQTGMILPVFSEKLEQLVYYKLADQVHQSGLHGYLLTPLKKDASLPALLTFRGTDGSISTHRDLDPTGIGKQVFDACAETIYKMGEEFASKTTNSSIEIIGHSLGAVDAQRALINFTNPENNPLFSDIKLFTYCSPKLDQTSVETWKKNIETLAALESRPSIDLNFAYHVSDLVTWTGDLPLSRSKNYFMKHCYLIVKSDSGVTGTPKHHTSQFFKNGNFDHKVDNRTFERIQNFSEEEIEEYTKKIQELEDSYQWFLAIKRYFVEVESVESLEEQFKRIVAEQRKFEQHNPHLENQSWWNTTSSQAIRYILHPIHSVFGWVIGANLENSEDVTV